MKIDGKEKHKWNFSKSKFLLLETRFLSILQDFAYRRGHESCEKYFAKMSAIFAKISMFIVQLYYE